MKLIPLNIDSIRTAEPLPFALRDETGVLLAHKGFVIQSREDLAELVARGRGLYVEETEDYHRAYVGKLHGLLRAERPIGQIAETQISAQEMASPSVAPDEGPPDWLDLQVQANTLLRDTSAAHFLNRLDRFHDQLQRHTQYNPDGVLFALFHLAAAEVEFYSATHAMQVCVMCSLAAREVLNWPPELERTLSRAALTMNIGMTELQDRLAQQLEPVTPEQRKQIDFHAARSVQLLKQLGVTDPVWLDAVRDHHSVEHGPLGGKAPAQRLARLIQRADMFSARLAPRATRVPVSPAAAMQATYFDESRQVDEAGAALIKAVGIYAPGSFVRLATNELAVVVRRGLNTTTPRVAVLINREGMAMVDPIVRDTTVRDYRIVASVPHREVKLKINLPRMLALTTASERAW